jgi:hypothetical protein
MAVCEAFPPLTLPALEGGDRPLADLWEHGPAVILLGHGNCDTTRFTLPHLARLHAERRAGTEVLAVLQDTAEGARATLERVKLQGTALPVALEAPPWPLAEALGVTTVPTLFLIAHGGAIEARSEGFSRDDLTRFATVLGTPQPFYPPDTKVPARRPG